RRVRRLLRVVRARPGPGHDTARARHECGQVRGALDAGGPGRDLVGTRPQWRPPAAHLLERARRSDGAEAAAPGLRGAIDRGSPRLRDRRPREPAIPRRGRPLRDRHPHGAGVRMNVLSLAGTSVLIVEDNFVVADALRFLIDGHGGSVSAVVPSLQRAFEALAAARVDIAVLD